VDEVKKLDDAFIHYGKLVKGIISANSVTAEIDAERRADIARNHTATHLVHKALRTVLGDHVQQKGSLVHPEYMRFDFTHVKALSCSESEQVENLVNAAIRANMQVSTKLQDIASAKADGATALFGEKYSDEVRVISIDDYSKELCGGTHASATGDIGIFKIVSEGSVAAGIRRIEAVTGRAALEYIADLQRSLSNIAAILNCPSNMVEQKLETQKQQIHDLENRIKEIEEEQIQAKITSMLQTASEYEGFKLCIHELTEGSNLKSFADILRGQLRDQIAVLLCKKGDKLSILAAVGKELIPNYNAGKIVSAIATQQGGKGGGRPDSAMAGCPLPADLDDLKQQIPEIIKSGQ